MPPDQPRQGFGHPQASTVPKSAAAEPLQRSIDNTPRTVFGLNKDDHARRVQDLADEFFDASTDSVHDGEPTRGADESLSLSGDEAGALDKRGEIVEGAAKRVSVLKHERDPEARRICINAHGARCKACGIDFGEVYGDFAQGFIHVHHKTPVAQAAQDGEYRLNPKTDLVPVCPNCHAMLHRHPDDPCTVAKLKQLMKPAVE